MIKKLFLSLAFFVGGAHSGLQAADDAPQGKAIAGIVGSALRLAAGNKFKEVTMLFPALTAVGAVEDVVAILESKEEDDNAKTLALYLRVATSTLPSEEAFLDEDDTYTKESVATLKNNSSGLSQLLWAYGLIYNNFKGQCGCDDPADEDAAYTEAARILTEQDIEMPRV